MTTAKISVQSMGQVISQDDMLELVGQVAGECYMSDMSRDKCTKRALNCILRGHHSPWEHVSVKLKCTVDRGTSHALVRHRHCAFQQSSTIYHKYKNGIVVISETELPEYKRIAYEQCEQSYMQALEAGEEPSEARDVLPTALATNVIITTNIREWMYMLHRRVGPGDSTKMHIWAQRTREWFKEHYPLILETFDMWYDKHPL